MNFGPEWSHGPRLVFRRVYELLVGPTPSVHVHHDGSLWQFPTVAFMLALLLFTGALDSPWWFLLSFTPIPVPFINWQRPVTDSAYHFDRLGVDFFFGPWTWCVHWIDH